MPPILKNPWGVAGPGRDSFEVQRSDLWSVDLRKVYQGLYSTALGSVLNASPDGSAQASSVAFPAVGVKKSEFNRGSRPYLMPMCDEPTGPVRIVFIVDSKGPGSSSSNGDYLSNVVTLFNLWRSAVRTGRGPMSGGDGDDDAVMMDSNYLINYRFPIRVTLLRGGEDGIVPSSRFELVDAWPESHQLSELSYAGSSSPVTLTTILNVSSIVDIGHYSSNASAF